MSLYVDIRKKLGDFSLTMQMEFPDEPTAVIGASGSGKSILLRCIAGIETPDDGRITAGQDIWYDSTKKLFLPPQKRHAGYLFQQYALFENKTVAGNIMLGMTGTKAGKQQRCSMLLERFQLTGLAGLRPTQLSGGQKQRTALARMLAAEPEVLLLDEPFSALDTHLRGQVRRQMAEVMEQHSGVSLLVTHDFSEALQLCSHAAVVSDGKIVEYGPCIELWKQPKTRACAELTGMRNFIPVPEDMEQEKPAMQSIGIRPEHLRPARENDSLTYSGVVRRILPGIYSSQVEIETAHGTLLWETARGSPELPIGGQSITLSADEENLHFFLD